MMKKKNYYLWIFISFAVAMAFIIWNRNSGFSCEKWESAERKFSCAGLVTKKFRDKSDHGERTVVLADGTLIDEVSRSNKFWEAVEIGDSILKDTGTLVYTVKKSDTTLSFLVPCVRQW